MPIPAEVVNRLQAFAYGNAGSVAGTVRFVDDVISRQVSGSFMECGVAGGVHPAAMALTLDAAGADPSRRVFLCDSFDGIPRPGPRDIEIRQCIGDGNGELESTGVTRHTLEDVQTHMRQWGVSPARLVYTRGWFQHTLLPLSVAMRKRSTRLALLRIDGDLYESVRCVMETMVPLLNPGGILILDDYTLDGAKAATDEWCGRHGIKIEPLPVPGAEPTVWMQWPGMPIR